MGGQKKMPIEPAPISLLGISIAQTLPESLDWRDHNGNNYISTPRNQGACGSCYAFASTDAWAARFNILQFSNTTFTENDLLRFSPQEVLSCSSTNQGCEGGFP